MNHLRQAITPWGSNEARVGEQVRRVGGPFLKEVLFEAYKSVDPSMVELPDELYDVEKRKFDSISVGRVSVSNKKLGISTGTVSEEALLVPHWTGRILSRVPAIGSAADLAEQAYERLDGSGVGHGLLAPALSANARLVQAVRAVVEASDCYSKGQFNVENARAALQREVEQGRLDGRIVDAVLVGLGSKRLLGLNNQPDTSLTVRKRCGDHTVRA